MTCLKLTPPAVGTVPALLTRSPPLTAQAFFELEHEIIDALALLGRSLFGSGVWPPPAQATGQPDAGEIEYASWMPDPGAIEVASWTVHLRNTDVRPTHLKEN